MATTSVDMLRAQHAMAKIAEVKGFAASAEPAQRKRAEHYASYVKALPANIIQTGLGQALATLLARSKGQETATREIYLHLQDWLCRQHTDSPYYEATQDPPDLLCAIVEGDEDEYLRAQSEAMAYLAWLKKLAAAQLDEEGPRP
jgi:CRISPR-associated protein Cmr5